MDEEIFRIIRDLTKKEVSLYTNLSEIGVDSLTLLKIVMAVENEFGVHFEDKEIVEIRYPEDIKNFLSTKLS